MSNELMTQNLASSYNPFLDAADDMGATGGYLFAKFDGNIGVFTYGKDGDELEKGSRHILNIDEVKRGYICWKDGSVAGEVMVPVANGKPPHIDSLEDHGPYEDDQDGWREQSSIAFQSLEDGREYLFKTSSKSGKIAVANLVRDYGKQFMMHPGEVPVIELSSTSFDATDAKGKKLGKKHAPNFKIVGWKKRTDLVISSDVEDSSEVTVVDVEEDAPVQRGRRF